MLVPSDEVDERPTSLAQLTGQTDDQVLPPVDPKTFLSQCHELGKNKVGNRCTALSAYETACKTKGVSVSIHSDCLRCQLDAKTQLDIGDVRKLTGGAKNRGAADVLFLLENGDCLRTLSKRFKELLSAVDKELQQLLKAKNSRFGFIIYGSIAQVVSLNAEELFVPKKAQDILKHIISTYPSPDFGNPSQDLSALSQAIEAFPFRYQASRSVIVVPCSSCVKQNPKIHKQLAASLESSRAAVHVIFSEEFDFLKTSEKRTISGFDLTGGLTNKVAAAALKVPNHEQLLRKEAGMCADVAFRTNGTIFTSQRLFDVKAEGKRAIAAFARQVALRAEAEPCVACRCTQLGTNLETGLVCEPCGNSNKTFGITAKEKQRK